MARDAVTQDEHFYQQELTRQEAGFDQALYDAETDPPVVETFTTPDGWIVDAETGEIVGNVAVAHFQVTDARGADWVLEKLQDAEAMMLAEEAKLRAITECIQLRITAQRRRRDWLQKRFGPDLEHYAAQELAGAKTRTLILDHGRISFRKSPGSTKVTDMAGAVAWAKEHAPEAIKITETVLVTPLKGRDDLPAGVFEITGPSERCTVETGIRPERGRIEE